MIDSTGQFHTQNMSSTYLRLKGDKHLSDERTQRRSNWDTYVSRKSVDRIIKLTYVGNKAQSEEGFEFRDNRR